MFGICSGHVYPTRGRVRAFAQTAVLRRGFIHRWHLDGGKYKTVENHAIQFRVAHRLRLAARAKQRCLGIRIVFEECLPNVRQDRHSSLPAADDHRR
jgi:hypothetical protein